MRESEEPRRFAPCPKFAMPPSNYSQALLPDCLGRNSPQVIHGHQSLLVCKRQISSGVSTQNLGTSPPREARSLLGRTIFRSAPFPAICSSHTCHECRQDENGDKYTVELNPLGSGPEQNNTAGRRGRPGHRYSTTYMFSW